MRRALTHSSRPDINVRNALGATPLLLAVRLNSVDAVELLLACGASCSEQCLTEARQNGFDDLEAILATALRTNPVAPSPLASSSSSTTSTHSSTLAKSPPRAASPTVGARNYGAVPPPRSSTQPASDAQSDASEATASAGPSHYDIVPVG